MLINTNNQNPRMNANPNSELVYPELSYKIMNVLFKVHNELGSHLQEKHYQRAIEEELIKRGLQFEKEKIINILYNDRKIGSYFLDFIIEGKIALEIKTIDFFKKKEWNQIRRYLKTANLKLGILANFNGDRLIYKRILNSSIRNY